MMVDTYLRDDPRSTAVVVFNGNGMDNVGKFYFY